MKLAPASTTVFILFKSPEMASVYYLVLFCFVKIVLVVVYCAPKTTYTSEFWQGVEEALTNINKSYDYVILIGDLNIKLNLASPLRTMLVNSLLPSTWIDFISDPFITLAVHTTIYYICITGISRVLSL